MAVHENEAVVSTLQIGRRLLAIFKMVDQHGLQVFKTEELKTWLKARSFGSKQELIACVSKAKHNGTELLVVREKREKK